MNNKTNTEDYTVSAIVRFMKCFVNEKSYRDCAQKHNKSLIYAADFLFDAERDSFRNICKKVYQKKIDEFYVIVCLSTVYDDGFNDSGKFYQIKKDELIKLLKIQEEDMAGEALVYAKNIGLTDFWDMIIFDGSFSWAYTLTHEDDLDGSRICYVQDKYTVGQSGPLLI